VQICAKLGGIPWTISEMPFQNIPTMVFGIDLLTKITGKNRRQILAMVGTVNKSFSKYWSTCKCISEGEKLLNVLPQCMIEALDSFNKENKILP
jgi:aubergine-like protein